MVPSNVFAFTPRSRMGRTIYELSDGRVIVAERLTPMAHLRLHGHSFPMTSILGIRMDITTALTTDSPEP